MAKAKGIGADLQVASGIRRNFHILLLVERLGRGIWAPHKRLVVAMPPLAGAPGAASSGQELTVPP